MVRKVTANLYMTLDGRGEFPKYPNSDRVPTELHDQMREMWANRYDDVTTVVMGRRSFTGHRDFHSEKARKPNDPGYMFDYSRWLDRVDKVCLSNRLKDPGWENSRVLHGDLGKILARLKREKGGNIIVDGGPSLISEVIDRKLADDYWLVVMPVVYGRGHRYWGTMQKQTTLKLLSAKGTQDGELLLHYEAVR